jgi:hypothetical protein
MTSTTEPRAATHGLPSSLRVPIAASGIESIETYVGEVVRTIHARQAAEPQRVNALLVRSRQRRPRTDPDVLLWRDSEASEHEQRLFPEYQVWVHVDYRRYKWAYLNFGLQIPLDEASRRSTKTCVLDHVQNREATRLRGEIRDLARRAGSTLNCRWHPYLRLCPVSGIVNSIAGMRKSGEDMEKEFLEGIREDLILSVASRTAPTVRATDFLAGTCHDVIYADPFDLTKMLNRKTGLFTMDGVRDLGAFFYA